MSIQRILVSSFAAITLTGAVFADNAIQAPNAANPAAPQQATAPQQAIAPEQAAAPANSAANEITKININAASAKELMKVKGINAARARAIVAYRKKHGEFKTLEALANVRGFKKMKPARLQEIESQISIN